MSTIVGRIIPIKYNNLINYVVLRKFNTDELIEMGFEDIVLSVVSFFNISRDHFAYFRDKYGEQLNSETVTTLVFQYLYCYSFILELCTTDQNPAIPLKRSYCSIGAGVYITTDSIRQHIKVNGGGAILDQFNKNQCITDQNRKLLTRILGRYLILYYGDKPSKEEKFAVAKAAVEIFTCFKSTNIYGGAELFFDPDHNTGYLVSQLKNLNFNVKKFNNTPSSSSLLPTIEAATSEQYDATDDLRFLKCAVLPAQSDKVKILLKRTVKERKAILALNTKLHEEFPYFFVDPELIVFDFEHQFGEPQVLRDKWPILQKNILTILSETGNTLEVEEWNTPTLALFSLIKLLPSSPGPLINKIEKLLIFKNTPKEEYFNENKQPYMIAVGPTPSSVEQYFIALDRHIICLPSDYDVIQAFNVLFCAIFVFSMQYDPALKNFFYFFENYVYNLNTKTKLSPRIRQICNRLDILENLKSA